MQCSDHGFILRSDPLGDSDALIWVFGKEHGILRGLAKRAYSSRQRGTYILGNRVEIQWQARLEEHLGRMSAELIAPVGSAVMADKWKCYVLQSLCALIPLAIEERDPHPKLYQAADMVLEALQFTDRWLPNYARFEAICLEEAGYGLGLDRCAATGTGENLRYVSPRSGCAVSAEAGEPYRDKLFAYPQLLTAPMHSHATPEEVIQSLQVTEFFIEKWMLQPFGKPVPMVRQHLMQALKQGLKEPSA